MVKKSSFFEKLKNRLRSGDVKVGTPGGVAGSRLEDPVVAHRELSAASSRKLSKQEAAKLAVDEGFGELTSLVRGMQTRVDEQGARFVDAAEGIARLPALGQAQLDMMRLVADRLEKQNEVMAAGLGKLPETLKGVREALERSAATDERTAETLGDFRSNMDRIQASMARMVDDSRSHAATSKSLAAGQREHVQDLTGRIEVGQGRMVERLEQAQADGVRTLRDAHADHATRVGKMIEDGTKTQRAVLILLGLVFVALVTIVGFLAAA